LRLIDRLKDVKSFHIFALLIMGWFGAVAALVLLFGLAIRRPSLHPEQPIEFPHHVHVQRVGMECGDCHRYADKSIHAGIPNTALCMECHESVATDRPEIIKLTAFHQTGEPIDWVRIYDFQDWVYFSHKRHVLSGVRCQECHGAVELMSTVQKVSDMGMGWCVNCHRRRGAPIECNTCHQ